VVENIENTTGEFGEAKPRPARTPGKRGIFWILAGLVATGLAAGYSWWKGLPKD
jgi:hypothetical protein